jgi:hypothetical protein
MTYTILFYRYNNLYLLYNVRSLLNSCRLFCEKWVVPVLELLNVQNISNEIDLSSHESCYPQVYALPEVKQNMSCHWLRAT